MPALADELPGEGVDNNMGRCWSAPGMTKLGLESARAGHGLPAVVGDACRQEDWRASVLEARVGEQQAGKFTAGVAAYPGDGGAKSGGGWSFMVVSQCSPRSSFSHGFCLLCVRADDEHGVVAGDGADDLRPVLVVDAGGYGLSAAGGGDQDEQVHARWRTSRPKLAQDLADAGGVFGGSRWGFDHRNGVAVRDLWTGAARECVARQRSLRDVVATRVLTSYGLAHPDWRSARVREYPGL